MLNQVIGSGQFQIQWLGYDAAYENDHVFLGELELPEGIWYFTATNAKKQVYPPVSAAVFP